MIANVSIIADEEVKAYPEFENCFVTKSGRVFEVREVFGTIHKSGHTEVFIHNLAGDQTKRTYYHRMVAETWIGTPPFPGAWVLHKKNHRKEDGSLDDSLDNLKYGNPSENSQDMVDHGTSTKGEKNGSARLVSEQVLEIRRRRALKEPARILAQEFNITVGHVYDIERRKCWNHI